jgi:hypothetical protein
VLFVDHRGYRCPDADCSTAARPYLPPPLRDLPSESHWQDRSLLPNRLQAGVTLF